MQSYWGQQRATDCTPARAWLDSGVVVELAHSPVTHYDPWLNIYGFATRDTRVAGILGPQHRIAGRSAARLYRGFSTDIGVGQHPGNAGTRKVADCICLDRDPLALPIDQVRQVRVTRTVVHGRQVFPV